MDFERCVYVMKYLNTPRVLITPKESIFFILFYNESNSQSLPLPLHIVLRFHVESGTQESKLDRSNFFGEPFVLT